MWDTKAVREASSKSLAVFPQHLRPARYDAARISYLEHLGVSPPPWPWLRHESHDPSKHTPLPPFLIPHSSAPLYCHVHDVLNRIWRRMTCRHARGEALPPRRQGAGRARGGCFTWGHPQAQRPGSPDSWQPSLAPWPCALPRRSPFPGESCASRRADWEAGYRVRQRNVHSHLLFLPLPDRAPSMAHLSLDNINRAVVASVSASPVNGNTPRGNGAAEQLLQGGPGDAEASGAEWPPSPSRPAVHIDSPPADAPFASARGSVSLPALVPPISGRGGPNGGALGRAPSASSPLEPQSSRLGSRSGGGSRSTTVAG